MSSEHQFESLADIIIDELYWWAQDAVHDAEMKDQLPTWHRILQIVQEEAERHGISLAGFRVAGSNRPTSDEQYLAFLRSLASRVKEESLSEANRLRASNDPLSLATLSAWAHAVTCMQVQADMLGLSRKQLDLGDIDPDNDIMGLR